MPRKAFFVSTNSSGHLNEMTCSLRDCSDLAISGMESYKSGYWQCVVIRSVVDQN
jgi:hypothetical protein